MSHLKLKKLALVLLALPFAGAYAQSNATLYGKVDLGYAISNGGNNEGKAAIEKGQGGNDGKFQQWGNALSSSRFGIKASEDLGNGLKVGVHLEAGFNAQNGEQFRSLFNRKATLSLTGGFGTLQAGRQTTTFNNVMEDFDQSGDPNVTSAGSNVMLTASQRQSRYDSALTYFSPNFNGLKVQSQFVSKNNSAPGMGARNIFSLGFNYEWDNRLMVGAVYETKTKDGEDSSWGAGAVYNFSSFSVGAAYMDNHDKADGRGLLLGVSVPINQFTVGAQLGYNTSARDGAGDKIKPLGWGLFSYYKMSQQTKLYFLVGGLNSDAKTFQAASRKYSAAMGMEYNF